MTKATEPPIAAPGSGPHRAALLLALPLLAALLAGCGDDAPSAAVALASPSPSAQADLHDVDGHRIYASCTGSGSPTVVYVHGSVQDERYVPHDSARGIRDALAEDHRVCLYDRRNTGASESVPGVQTPDDVLHDMEGVLDAAGAQPPYVLLAASFGGLVAYDYLNHHPDEVQGVVLLDAMIPDELPLDQYLPEDATFRHFREDDACCTVERLPQYDLIESLQQYVGHEPAVPLVYLASAQDPPEQNGYGSPEYDARIGPARAAFVGRFSPGRLETVDAPHFMEPVIPDRIAQAVRDVVELGRG